MLYENLDELASLDDFTIAFSRIPLFSIVDSHRENYPMVVEVDIPTSEMSHLQQLGDVSGTSVYATNRPIPISPTSSRLLFFRRQDLDYTRHSCSDSAKCKLFNSFKLRFDIADKNYCFDGFRQCISHVNKPNSIESYSEDSFDKVKGFIWGYGIGQLLSISNETAHLLKIQKRVYDIVSSTKNDSFIAPTLLDELGALDSEFSKYDPAQRLAKENWETFAKKKVSDILKIDNINITSIDSLLKAFDVENTAKNKFLAKAGITFRKKISEYSPYGANGYKSYSEDLEAYTKRLIYQERLKIISMVSIKEELDVDNHSYTSVMLAATDSQSELFNKILVRIIWEGIIPSLELLRTKRAEIARNIVITLKSIIEENGQWTGTDIQVYFNNMRKNISEFAPFNLKSINNSIFQSVAAFILKGEDFDSLIAYLEANAVSDYRYVLALWGAMNGYISIPRSIIESKLNESQIRYLFTFSQKALSLSDYGTELPAINLPTIYEPKDPTNTTSSNDTFQDKVLHFFNSKIARGANKKDKEMLRYGLNQAFEHVKGKEDPFLFVACLNDYDKWGAKTNAWKLMRDYICPNYDELRKSKAATNRNILPKQKSTPYARDLFSDMTEPILPKKENKLVVTKAQTDIGNILADNVLIDIISSYLSSESISLVPQVAKQLNTDLKWFVNNYKQIYWDERKKEQVPGIYAKFPKVPHSVIENLSRYLQNKHENPNGWLKDLYQDVPISRIIAFLSKNYGN
jgi:hypothetical protein